MKVKTKIGAKVNQLQPGMKKVTAKTFKVTISSKNQLGLLIQVVQLQILWSQAISRLTISLVIKTNIVNGLIGRLLGLKKILSPADSLRVTPSINMVAVARNLVNLMMINISCLSRMEE